MPFYVYKCDDCEQLLTVQHRMLYTTGLLCPDDGASMHRVPQLFRVNWDGPAPSQWEIHPSIKQHVRDAERNRDEFKRRKAEVHK